MSALGFSRWTIFSGTVHTHTPSSAIFSPFCHSPFCFRVVHFCCRLPLSAFPISLASLFGSPHLVRVSSRQTLAHTHTHTHTRTRTDTHTNADDEFVVFRTATPCTCVLADPSECYRVILPGFACCQVALRWLMLGQVRPG